MVTHLLESYGVGSVPERAAQVMPIAVLLEDYDWYLEPPLLCQLPLLSKESDKICWGHWCIELVAVRVRIPKY